MFGELDDYIGYDPVLPGKNTSIWIDTTDTTDFPSLTNDIEVDVAIIGGGIAGITTAEILKEEGRKVAVIESHRICDDVSGHTTAKVTSQHGLIYKYLIDTFGKEKARFYARSNQLAIKLVSALIAEKKIACDHVPNSSYLFTESKDEIKTFQEEADAVHKLGLPGYFTDEIPLPDTFEPKAGIRFTDQAQFHPRKYLVALAKDINQKGNYIFENTRALTIKDGDPCEITTDKGTIKARKVIVTTNFPIFDTGSFYSKLQPKRSYVLGLKIRGEVPKEMFYLIEKEENYHSLRNQPYGDGTILLLGGESHKAGNNHYEQRYQNLERYAKKHFQIEEITHHWSTQDNVTIDRVPYIGLAPKSKNTFIATGFRGWGMTNGTVAAMLISDLVMNKKNPWSGLYDPSRFKVGASAKQFAKQNFSVAGELFRKNRKSKLHFLTDVREGRGEIIEYGGKKMAVSRDEGVIYEVSSTCTHMGCQVGWNNAEKTWDCPCHGSRYKPNGEVIHAPATKDLENEKDKFDLKDKPSDTEDGLFK